MIDAVLLTNDGSGSLSVSTNDVETLKISKEGYLTVKDNIYLKPTGGASYGTVYIDNNRGSFRVMNGSNDAVFMRIDSDGKFLLNGDLQIGGTNGIVLGGVRKASWPTATITYSQAPQCVICLTSSEDSQVQYACGGRWPVWSGQMGVTTYPLGLDKGCVSSADGISRTWDGVTYKFKKLDSGRPNLCCKQQLA